MTDNKTSKRTHKFSLNTKKNFTSKQERRRKKQYCERSAAPTWPFSFLYEKTHCEVIQNEAQFNEIILTCLRNKTAQGFLYRTQYFQQMFFRTLSLLLLHAQPFFFYIAISIGNLNLELRMLKDKGQKEKKITSNTKFLLPQEGWGGKRLLRLLKKKKKATLKRAGSYFWQQSTLYLNLCKDVINDFQEFFFKPKTLNLNL